MGKLRVIGGKARGRRLNAVPGDTTRPITDRTKESLFNIIGGDIIEATFLDLFAGTGSVGIEALSRGAAFVRFIDRAPAAIKTIRNNLQISGLADLSSGKQSEILQMDAFNYLEGIPDKQFDYVYIAPPQYKELWLRAVLSIDQKGGWLSKDAWVIAQIHPVEYQKLSLSNLEEFDQRSYGSTLLVFLRQG
jgi:16S rRNA (guanine(966)-N(2))-methyltransferase RsmD